MEVSYKHESVRLTGRWDLGETAATATATGSYVEFAFEGKTAVARFDTLTNAEPRLHLWVQVDGGDMTEAAIDSYLRVVTKRSGMHVVRVIYKGGPEHHRRWSAPLTGKVTFVGVQTEKPVPIPPDDRKTIEFVGDSITEGVLIDRDFDENSPICSPIGIEYLNRAYQDDVCATYGWLVAEKLNLRPTFMGYGAVGLTRGGNGGVPAATVAYPFNFDGSPLTRPEPDYVVINHGANDRSHTLDEYLTAYEKMLDTVRALNPHAKIICLSAFCGAFHKELGAFVARYNAARNENVGFIDSNGWIPLEPLHPERNGHATVARRLAPRLKELL